MSVQEYIYPRDETSLSLGTLIPMLQAHVPGLVLTEIDSARRSSPNWLSLLFGHPKSSKCASLIVRSTITTANMRDVCERYRSHKSLLIVKQASRLYRSQLKMGSETSLAKMKAAIDVHDRILLTIVRLTRGVVDLPENEKLYTAAGFARHIRSLT